jgi:hypothetical protein
VTGANLNKARLVEAAAEGSAAATARAVDSVAVYASSHTAGQQSAAGSVFVRLKAVFIAAVMFSTTGAASEQRCFFAALLAAETGSCALSTADVHEAVVATFALLLLTCDTTCAPNKALLSFCRFEQHKLRACAASSATCSMLASAGSVPWRHTWCSAQP